MAIRIDPELVRQRAMQYRKEADNISEVIKQMNTLKNCLREECEGRGIESYTERYETEFKPSFENTVTLIGEIADALDYMAKVQEEADLVSEGVMGS